MKKRGERVRRRPSTSGCVRLFLHLPCGGRGWLVPTRRCVAQAGWERRVQGVQRSEGAAKGEGGRGASTAASRAGRVMWGGMQRIQ
eukprot:scaffold5006_cov116-Isochrysis_galbana.AAC.9